MIALTVLWNEKDSDLMANYLSIIVWRRLPSELTSPVEWSPRAEGSTLCSISQRTAPGQLKARIWIWIYSIPSEKENRIKITRILSINALLSPSFRNIWGFFSGSRVLLHCSNERLEYYAARGKPLWRHNGFVTSSMHSHDKTNERILSYRCANNAVVKAITESSAVSLGFWRKPSDTDMQTT